MPQKHSRVCAKHLIGDSIDSAEFHIEKADLPRLAEALQLPPTFHCQQWTVFDSMEGLCMLLKLEECPTHVGTVI